MGTVAYEGHPQLRVPWMRSVLAPAFRRSLTEGSGEDMGTIDGREGVISYGQWLGERADEELFCLFTRGYPDGLLVVQGGTGPQQPVSATGRQRSYPRRRSA